MKPNKTVLVFGSFDMLHRGHRYFLQCSREHGQRVLAVLARDEEIAASKQREPAWTFRRRAAALLQSGLVDEVICSDIEYGSFGVLQRHGRIDLILLGDGQKALGAAIETFFLANPALRCEVSYIAPHRRKLHSSTARHQLRYLIAHVAIAAALLFWTSAWVMGKVIAISQVAAPLAATLRMALLAAFFFVWQSFCCGYKIAKQLRSRQHAGGETHSPARLVMLTVSRQAIMQHFSLQRRSLGYLLLSGLCFAVYNLCFFYGLSAVFASRGGILTTVLIPCFSALLYSYIHRCKLRRSQLLGLLLGLVSGLALAGGLNYIPAIWHSMRHNLFGAPNGPAAGLPIHWPSGWFSSLFVGTALSWSLLTLLSSKMQQSYSLQCYSLYTYLFAAGWTSWGWFWYRTNVDWLPLLGLVFVGSILGTSCYFFALRSLRPHYVAGFLFFNPVLILLMSWLLLAEPWTLDLSIGSLLATLAIILLNRKHN